MESNELVKGGYQISVRNREGKRGGGLTLIYGSNIIAKELPQREQRTFKVTHWMTTIGNSTLDILGIYHPPYSVGQNITNAMFLDNLTEFRTNWMTSYRNVLICEDFNMHTDNPLDMVVQTFMDTMEALGLQQHVNFQIYQAGNIFDLIFVEATSQFSIRTFKGRFVSDHRAIVAELSIGIQCIMARTISFRNLKQINVDEFGSPLNLGHIENMKPLELVNRTYQEELSRVLNHIAL